MSTRWEEVRLGDIANIQRGASPRPISDTIWFDDNSDVSWVRISDVNGKYLTKTEQYLSQKGIEKSRFVDVNTVIMSMCATLGRPTITKVKACIHDGFVCFNNLKTDTDFLYYFLQSIENSWKMQGQTGSQANLNTEIIKNVKIKLPPLKEQEKIAEILSSCDEHIKNLKNLKSELEKEKLHLMNELLSGKTRFANFTTPWQEVALKDLGEYRRGSFPQPYGNKEWYDGEGSMPFVQVFDVDDNFKLKPTTLKRISKLAQPKSIFIPKGSVIITIQGSIGRTAITQYDCYLDRTLLYFEKFLIPIDKKFFMYALFSVFEVEKLKAPGGTIKTITKEALSDFKIKLPSLEEQKKIGEVLSACDERLECLNELITAQTNLKSHLLTELLNGNIRVKDFK